MAAINYTLKEIGCKIVYYGPGLGGKTTNLKQIHDMVATDQKGNLISLATPGERTLFFDFLPIDAPRVHGFTTKFQLYTVPGQQNYNATRRLVLRGVDGVVFVCDSQWDKLHETVQSFRNLQENLATYGTSLAQVPFVIQFNKRDLDGVAPTEYLQFLLNEYEVPSFETVAVNGDGVLDTLNCISERVLANLRHKHGRTE